MPTLTPPEFPTIDRATLRRGLLKSRLQLQDRAAREAALSASLARVLRTLHPECVGAYCATRGEFDPHPTLQALHAEAGNAALALPVVDPATHSMRFVLWAPGDALQKGPYDIAEPAHQDADVTPDVLLIPCVGFLDIGLRLGYGGGYYDRYLARHPEIFTIGLAFDVCRIESLDSQPHDRLLDVILTETAAFGMDAGIGQEPPAPAPD